MTSNRNQTRRLMAWGITGLGLWLNQGCSLSSAVRSEPDHVYSETTPQMIEQERGVQPRPARARYPDEDSTAAIETGGAADGVVRLGGSKPSVATANSLPNSMATSQSGNAAHAMTFEESLDHEAALKKQSGIQLTSFQQDAFCPPGQYAPGESQIPGAPGFCPAEPRLESNANGQPLYRMETIAASPYADLYADEYIFDGGDRELSAAMHTDRSGLDTEDTVAAFADHTGELRTTASNKVAVYAPRFGSIRTVTSLVADTKVDKAAGAKDSLSTGNLKTGNAAQENVHDTVLYGFEKRDRLDGMKASTPPMQARRTENAGQSRKVDEGHEGRAYSSPSALNRNDAFVLAQQMQNASAWTRDQFPVITAVTTNASEITANFKVQQTIGVKDERETRGNVHIVKLADRELAQSGDTITFTIRFENTGDFDVYDVAIVDNLTPRLDYVGGSAQIDEKHPGEVTVEPNGEGSSILTFRLDKPLKGHETGTITFEATVR